MPAELAYIPSATNVPKILDKIRSAATPPKFTHEFLKSNLGFASSNDRAVIKVLKALGFLTSDGTPTARYNDYRGANPGGTLAAGIRSGYGPLFLSDERIYERSGSDLLGIVKNTTGSGDAVAKKIVATFRALSAKADWSAENAQEIPATDIENDPEMQPEPEANPQPILNSPSESGAFRLHHDIHIHLPPTSDVSVYRAIFQAMKSELI